MDVTINIHSIFDANLLESNQQVVLFTHEALQHDGSSPGSLNVIKQCQQSIARKFIKLLVNHDDIFRFIF